MSGISNLFFKRLLSRLSSEEKMEISRWESQSESHRDLSRRLSDPGVIDHELRMRSIIDTERAESDRPNTRSESAQRVLERFAGL